MAYCSMTVQLEMIPVFPRLPSVTQKYVCNEAYSYLMVNISYMLMVHGVVVGWLITLHTQVCENDICTI